MFSLIIFTVPQPFIITALWSHDCSLVSSIKNPSEESSWNFPSTHGITVLIYFCDIKGWNPTGSLLEIFSFHEEESGEEILASKLFFFFFPFLF